MNFLKTIGLSGALLFSFHAAAEPQVMVLGTPHFAVPGQDQFNPDVGDVKTEHVRDIRLIVDALAQWKPTKIAIERTPRGMEREQKNYRDYLDGAFELTSDEIHQIGFRLAAHLGHEQLFGMDFQQEMDIGAIMSFAHANGQGERVQNAMARIQGYLGEREKILSKQGLREMLVYVNSEASDRADGEYLVFASIGGAESGPGATQVGAWYERNLRMYANTVNITNNPDDRVLVIVGDGHAPLLRQFFRQSPLVELVPLTL